MTLILILIFCIISYCLAESWNVYVHTGKARYAGTDANVYIRLFNSKGESTSEVQLTHDNWMPDRTDFPIRNLFETGARERFLIRTEDIGSVSKIQIRHNNFPILQVDWLLDQVIVEHIRDNAKFIFKCNCWLRRGNPSVTISVLPDRRTIDKKKTYNSSSKNNQALVFILIVLITLIVCVFCCINKYRQRRRRRRRHRSVSLNDVSEPIHQEPSLIDTYYPQSPGTSTALSGPQYWMNTIRQWKNVRNGLPPYNHTQTTQSTTAATTTATVALIDEPPAYEDLYPTTTTTNNTASNSNSNL